jgi:hypothetical protein
MKTEKTKLKKATKKEKIFYFFNIATMFIIAATFVLDVWLFENLAMRIIFWVVCIVLPTINGFV